MKTHRVSPLSPRARRAMALAIAAGALAHLPASLGAQPAVSAASSVPAGKKPITQDVYDLWRVIQSPSLSPDGRWAAYTVTPQVGDGEVIARATAAATEHRVSRGFTGRAHLTPPNVDSGFTAPPAQWSADSRVLAFMTYAPRAEFERARAARRPNPRAWLSLLSVADGQVTRIERVRSFRLPRDGGRTLVYQLEADSAAGRRDSTARPAAPPQAAAAAPGGAPRPVADSAGRPRAPRREFGTALVLRDLATGTETRIEDVLSYAVDDSGKWVGYVVSSREGGRDGAYVRSLADGRETALLTGVGTYRGLTMNRAASQIAFVSDVEEFGRDRARASLYHASLAAARGAAPKAQKVVASRAFGDTLMIAASGGPQFTRDGTAIVFGLANPPLDSIPADSLADKAVFDLWHWNEPRIQPQQRLSAGRDRNRSYTSIYHLGAKRAVRLGDDTLPQVQLSDDGRLGLAVTSVPYAVAETWGDEFNDIWLLDALTGKRTKLITRGEGRATLSPTAKYVVWFDSGQWSAYATATGKRVSLTHGIKGVRFDQETWDTPSTPPAWGIAGWTKDDASFLVYDRYDIWELDPAGVRPPRNVTDSAGARGKIIYRLVDADAEDRFVDPAQPLLLRAENEETRATGFWRDQLGVARAPERIVMDDVNYGRPAKARRGDTWMLTRQTYREFPDLYVGTRLDQLTRVSDANPQQKEYPWPTVETVRWINDDGGEMKGLLYKPEGFDPARKYPLLVSFYEQTSQTLHNYDAPAGRNRINPTVYASLGYLVFWPDITYTTGYPGESALHSIVPGVQALIARGYVDHKRIGIGGQSWGGYQSAYMITRTPMFAAAFLGAPVANMTSAYGGIRWESGLARAFQYEKSQSRIGGNVWQYPLRYIENSPLFFADRITTPVLIMHNDGDGAVPWQQGIEMYVAMRRLGKEAYLVNYNGDGHNPRKRANQKDIDRRMQQFFAHHLKGDPMPDWMKQGIPFLMKGRDQVAPAVPPQPAATVQPNEPKEQRP